MLRRSSLSQIKSRSCARQNIQSDEMFMHVIMFIENIRFDVVQFLYHTIFADQFFDQDSFSTLPLLLHQFVL